MLLISYVTYRLIHLFGIFLILLGLGALMSGPREDSGVRRLAVLSHGFGLLIILVAGFGLIARLGLDWPWPLWIYLKILIWLLFGGLLVFIRRAPGRATLLWWITLVLAGLAAWLALFKP